MFYNRVFMHIHSHDKSLSQTFGFLIGYTPCNSELIRCLSVHWKFWPKLPVRIVLEKFVLSSLEHLQIHLYHEKFHPESELVREESSATGLKFHFGWFGIIFREYFRTEFEVTFIKLGNGWYRALEGRTVRFEHRYNSERLPQIGTDHQRGL